MNAKPSNERTDNSIDGLRLLFAGLVVYGHAWYLGGFGEDPVARWLFDGSLNFAETGVQGFFVLSGYLIFQSERRLASTRAFIWNRLLRIYPALWFCLLLTGIILPTILWRHEHTTGHWPGAWAYFTRNLILPRTQIDITGLFPHVPHPGDLNGSLWTLTYEIGCYILLAFFGWLGCTRRGSMLPWLTGSLLMALYWFDVSWSSHAVFFKSHGRILCCWFLAGSLLALIPENILRPKLSGRMTLVATALLLISCRTGHLSQVAPITMAIIVLWLAWHLPGRRLKNLIGGDYSYGLYIYAYPTQQLLAHCGLNRLGLPLYFILSLFISVLLAVFSWHLIECPAMQFKAKRLPQSL